MPAPINCVVNDVSEVGTARRQGQQLATELGFDEENSARVGLAITELATNLVRHGGGGLLLIQPVAGEPDFTVEILSIDSGPGMADVAACMRDGFSKGGTSGSGLGAVKRLSIEFDIFSAASKGCVVLARIQSNDAAERSAKARWRWGSVSTPAPGESAIGDGWRMRVSGDELSLLVTDGLGHGPLAAEASDAAATVFEQGAFGQAPAFFTRAHQTMRSTRGAAIAMATGSLGSSTLRYAGVGNISGVLLGRDGRGRGLMSHNGTVGAEMRSVKELSYEWTAADRLIMHSDGLTSRWDLSGYAGLLDHHPSVIAAVLHRDFKRGKDDATVVVLERVA